MDNPMIEVRNLSKSYGPFVAVNDISFDVASDEVLGFLGPNGAGKTTTMRILTGYMGADGGSIRIGGREIAGSREEAKAQIGYLPESNPLYEDLTVYEYLDFMGEVRGLNRGLRRERIERNLHIYGLEGVATRDIAELSKGFRQRVGLAQSTLHDPPILILDEPTSGLDPNQIIEIRNLIVEIGKTRTVILSTHNLAEVEASCSRILIINRGSIVAHDTPEGLERRSRGSVLYVKIRGDEGIDEALGGLDGVNGVSRHAGEGEYGGYMLSCDHGLDLREAVYDLTVASGWKLIELRKESATLEDIFTQLTRGA